MKSQASKYLDLSHAAGSLSLRLLRVASNRQWTDDASHLCETASALSKMLSDHITLVFDKDARDFHALTSPQGLNLLVSDMKIDISDLVDQLELVSEALARDNIEEDLKAKARMLSEKFAELDQIAEERAAIAERGGETIGVYDDRQFYTCE